VILPSKALISPSFEYEAQLCWTNSTDKLFSIVQERGNAFSSANSTRCPAKGVFLRLTSTPNFISSNRPLKQFIAPGGANFSGGLHIPQGSLVSIPVNAVHHDAEFYPKPEVFDPFRFSGNREPGIPNINGNANDPSAIPKAQPWATINDRFLGFGQGRHACPGRFFGAAMLQMILSYIMTEYDILEVKGEMKPTYFFGIAFSSTTSRMVVKKRTL
jgi:hypothetical protein